jgi:sugar phosphate isomerase/epimerase
MAGFFMKSLLKQIQVHMPFRDLHDRYLDMVLQEGINPEISFDCAALDRFTGDDYRRIGDRLLAAGRTVTFHAPFMDLRPGAIDPVIRRVSRDRIRTVFDLAPYFRPLSVVCHPSFDNRYYVSTEELWVKNSMETWGTLLAVAEEADTIIALENVYEREPRVLKRLLSACPSPRLRFCFDAGHYQVFSSASLEEWIESLAPYLHQLHLHDNRGTADEHLPVGCGAFPFSRLFDLLRARGLRPIVTVEAHNEASLWQSLDKLGAMAMF